jgi:hypothetical protein
MRTLLVVIALLVLAGCGDNKDKTPTRTPSPAATEAASGKKSLAGYSQGVRDYYGDEVEVEPSGDPEHDIEMEYHQPPDPAEAAVGEAITLTGTNIGVRLVVTVTGVERVGEHVAVKLKLENNGIAVYNASITQAAVTYGDGKPEAIAKGERESCSNGFEKTTVRLDVSRKASGCVLFPAKGHELPDRFQLALENVPTEAGGIWNLSAR